MISHAVCSGCCPVTSTSSIWVTYRKGRVENPRSRKQRKQALLKQSSCLSKREDDKGFGNNRILLRVKNLLLSKAAACWGRRAGQRERFARGRVSVSCMMFSKSYRKLRSEHAEGSKQWRRTAYSFLPPRFLYSLCYLK